MSLGRMIETAFIIVLAGSVWLGKSEIAAAYTVGDAISDVQVGRYQKAIPFLEAAADDGNPAAAITLGLLYEFGNGVPQSFLEALELYALAAKGGIDAANFNIGEMYFQGRGVEVDYNRALQWFRQGAALGHPLSQFRLGNMKQDGLGTDADKAHAYVWYNLAVSGGYQDAEVYRDRMLGELALEQGSAAQEAAKRCQNSNFIDCPY